MKHWKLETRKKWDCEDRNNAITIVGSSHSYRVSDRSLKKPRNTQQVRHLSLSTTIHTFVQVSSTCYLTAILQFFPMWSGLLLRHLECASHDQKDIRTKSHKIKDTNCHLEKWFGIVKHAIMKSKKSSDRELSSEKCIAPCKQDTPNTSFSTTSLKICC